MTTKIWPKKNQQIDVSVILTTYNQPETLKLALESLLMQNVSGSYEIIICDDGSNAKLFSVFYKNFSQAKIPIKYIWQQHRKMQVAESTNNGIKVAKGKLLIFLDGDMVPALDFIARHVKAHNKSKLLVAGNRCWRNPNEVKDKINKNSISEFLKYIRNHEAVDEKTKLRDFNEKKYRIEWLNSPHPWRACISCNLSIERAPEVYFDENFIGWGVEDWELAYRLWKIHGYKPTYRDDIVAYHLETTRSGVNIFRRGRHEEIVGFLRNVFYFADKYPDLDREIVFFNLPRLFLDLETNRWKVRKDWSKLSPPELAAMVDKTREWLRKNKVYPISLLL